MNTNKIRYSIVMLASFPLLVLGGCASQDTNKAMEESVPSVLETNKPISQTQDPIALQQNTVIEVPENTQSNTTLSEDEHSISFSHDEEELYPPAIKPHELRIAFGFDKTEVDAQYHELLQQHAQYLAENKEVMLKVNGHTDSYGPKEYNKSLSKQRAEAVAKLLVEYGAPKERILIVGVADEEPLLSATRQSENRRVELDYQDQRLVSME